MAIKFVSILSFLIAATSTHAAGLEGGDATSIAAHPYYVSIEVADDGGLTCGGALISKDLVITTAQCLANYNVSQLVVRVGSDASGSGTVVPIAGYTFDGAYDFVTNENDVGLVKLATPITESSSIGVIKVASSDTKTGTNGVVIGMDASNYLAEAPVSVISATDCSSGEYSYSEDDLYDSQVCALSKSGNVCGMPNGSPLVANNELVGLVSWGYGCANKGNPAVYTNIAAVNSWIASASEKL